MKERCCKNCGKPLIGESQDDERQIEVGLCDACWGEDEEDFDL